MIEAKFYNYNIKEYETYYFINTLEVTNFLTNNKNIMLIWIRKI